MPIVSNNIQNSIQNRHMSFTFSANNLLNEGNSSIGDQILMLESIPEVASTEKVKHPIKIVSSTTQLLLTVCPTTNCHPNHVNNLQGVCLNRKQSMSSTVNAFSSLKERESMINAQHTLVTPSYLTHLNKWTKSTLWRIPCQLEKPKQLTGFIRVWLQTVDHVVVSLQQHQMFACVAVQDEDVSTVRATQHKVFPPETRLFGLQPEP